MILVLMGVSGSGKTTVGKVLARDLGWTFIEADDFHPAANVEKMRRGEPLDDEDRRPWLDAVGEWLAAPPDGAVMSCSALRRDYRDRLRHHAARVAFVHLAGSREVIAARMAGRPGHFMPTSLLDSQFATLEPLAADEAGVTIDIDQSVDDVVQQYVDQLTEEQHS